MWLANIQAMNVSMAKEKQMHKFIWVFLENIDYPVGLYAHTYLQLFHIQGKLCPKMKTAIYSGTKQN